MCLLKCGSVPSYGRLVSIALSLLPVEIGRAVNDDLEKAAKSDEFFEALIKKIFKSGCTEEHPTTSALASLLGKTNKKKAKGDSDSGSDSSTEYPSPWVSMVHSDP